jgi:hypothetical protein
VAKSKKEKPYEIVCDDELGGMIQSRELSRPVLDPPTPEPARGLSTNDTKDGKLALSDRDYVDDFKLLRGMIEQRKRAKPGGYRELPGGRRISADNVLMFCSNPHCRMSEWMDVKAEQTACLRCNHQNYRDGGRLRLATKAEEAEWLKREAESIRRWKADAPRRGRETAEANRRRFADAGSGDNTIFCGRT